MFYAIFYIQIVGAIQVYSINIISFGQNILKISYL